MAEKCDLDQCSLSEDVSEIKADTKETNKMINKDRVERGKFEEKIITILHTGKEEHKRFNKNVEKLYSLNRGTVKWTHLSMALIAISIIIGITVKLTGG